MELPDKLGPCIDMAYDLQQKRTKLDKEYKAKLKEVKDQEDMLEAHMFELFGNDALKSAGGLKATANLKVTRVPQPKDWDKIYEYILQNKAFELLHKRLTVTAFLERLEAGEQIPGIETFEKMEITIHGR